MFNKYKQKIKQLENENRNLKAKLDNQNPVFDVSYKMEYLKARGEAEELKFKIHQKEDISEVIKQTREIYTQTMDDKVFKQYIELVKLYNRIGE